MVWAKNLFWGYKSDKEMTQKQSLARRFEHNTFLPTFQCNGANCDYLIMRKNWTLTT